METPTLYSLADVARIFDVSREAVRRWVRAGTLSASRAGREYKVSQPDLEAFYRRRGGGELFRS